MYQQQTYLPLSQPWLVAGSQPTNYWNYYAPGPYFGMGVMPQFFPNNQNFQRPGGGGVMDDKPVVYVTAPDHTEISISIKPKDSNFLLATVPSLPDHQWKARVEKNALQTNEGIYEYFFYDARVAEDSFQDQAGFCGERNEVLTFMANGLKTRGFPENSIQEFKSTWSIKLPWHQSLCVYPQTEKEISHVLEIKIEPANAKLTQLQFVVVPKLYHQHADKKIRPKFSKAPSVDFVFPEELDRKLAATDKAPHVYDWGVGFMAVDRSELK